MNRPYRISIIFLMALGLVMVPVISINITNNANARLKLTTQPQQQYSTLQNGNSSSSSKPLVGQVFMYNEKSKPANDVQKCAALAGVVKGKAVPAYNLCDVIVYRQSPPIIRSDGLVLNNFSGVGHYIEFVPATTLNNTKMFMGTSNNATSVINTGNNTNNKNLKAAFGEFALLDSEVVPVRHIMQKYNWTETALHHHMLTELPKILFLHWTVTGNANDIINQAKEIMMQTSTYKNTTGQTRTPTSSGP
jgi:hypothetical protein